MTNQIDIVVGANETASDKLGKVGKAAQKAEKVIVGAMGNTEAAFDTAARGSSKLGDALDKTEGFTGKLGQGVSGVSDAIDGFNSIANHSADKQRAMARAEIDVQQAANDAKQAVEDYSQAQRDGAQSGLDYEQSQIDAKQALVDQTTAQTDYNAAVKEHGANSAEAKQALVDLSQAQLDAKQATEDGMQAQRDGAQASIDMKQAQIDQKGSAVDLAEANSNLASSNSTLGKVSDYAGLLGGALAGLSGIIGSITAIQWLWNIAMSANPIGLIVAAVAVLIGVIIYLATKTQFFQTIWRAIWSKIGDPVKAAWSWIKSATSSLFSWFGKVFTNLPKTIGHAFKSVTNFLFLPFKAAFNLISWAWNNTIGRLSFSIPSWVPGIGGASFTAPRLPSLAVGGDVLKSGLAYIHQGERVTTAADAQRYNRDQAASNSHAEAMSLHLLIELENILSGNKLMDAIHEGIRLEVKRKGGNVQVTYGRGSAS